VLGFAFLEGAATGYAGGRYDMAAVAVRMVLEVPVRGIHIEEVTGTRTKIQMPTWVWLGGGRPTERPR
jgi:hypothetical protein